MLSSKTIIWIILAVLILGIIGVIKWFTSKKPGPPTPPPPPPPPPPPICDCKEWEVCVDGKCEPLTVCGQPIVPSGERCSVATLVCDESAKQWHCDGPINCDEGWEGVHCTCDKGDRQLTDFCNGQVPVCNEDGSYSYRQAATCDELNLFLEGAGLTLDGECHEQCNGKTCGNNGTCICNDSLGEADISCLKHCNPAPDPLSGECGMTPNNPSVSCPEFQTCICDITTGYDWKCATVDDPSKPNQCPPDPPQKYCKDSAGKDMDLVCMPCVYEGQEGAIKFCPGSDQIPLDCLKSRYGLVQDSAPTVGSGSGTTSWYSSQIESNLPVYPTVDNELCEAGKVANTRLQSDIGIFYSAVGNPSGNIVTNQSGTYFLPFSYDSYYYQSSNDPTVACYWSDHPDCSARGSFHQFCSPGQPCSPGDPISSRLKQGQCDCDQYISQFTGAAKKYVGCNCQFSDADCNNNGTAYTDKDCSIMNCSCGSGTNGPKCEFTRTNSCGGHGNPAYDGTCASCDTGYTGNHCQYSRATTCSNRGDPNSSGQCVCDSGWAGSNCSFNTTDPNTAWVGTCYCDGQLDVCHASNQSQDVSQRADCAISGSVYSGLCGLGPNQGSARDACNSNCYAQGC
jgi:hypothetical protein